MHADPGRPTAWQKYPQNPVLGGELGTCFDIAVLRERGRYRMYFSWRPKKSIAVTESDDGVRWDQPRIVLAPNPDTDWETRVNRPGVVRREDGYHMWYTGQDRKRAWIGYATSLDGLHWARRGEEPVLGPEHPWEGTSVMCPHVLWAPGQGLWRMWYSGGEQYEPDAIGYATSEDGQRWRKWDANPVFVADPDAEWERHKVTAGQIVRHGDAYLLFYIGFRDVHHARIGLARSPDGITQWERHPANPIITPDPDRWDGDACYKPFAVCDKKNACWRLWYNGRRGRAEQIGMAIHRGTSLWPPATPWKIDD